MEVHFFFAWCDEAVVPNPSPLLLPTRYTAHHVAVSVTDAYGFLQVSDHVQPARMILKDITY